MILNNLGKCCATMIDDTLQDKTRQDNVEVADTGTTVPLCPDLNYPFQKYNINYYLMRFLNDSA